MRSARSIRKRIDVLLLLVVLPAAGLVVSGRPVGDYLEFPPLTRHVAHAGFSWSVFALLAAGILAAVGPFVARVLASQAAVPAAPPRVATRRLPWWGWFGLALAGTGWVLAWTRFAWFAPWQSFTFSPMWLGYILVANALTWRRSGVCMMLQTPWRFAGLFAVSAAFWWYFEYLNRFVQNWYYIGADHLSRREYFIFATLPFATVLPAVLGTYDLLATYPRLSAGLERAWPLHVRRSTPLALGVFAAACAGLACIGRWPDQLFPLLWVAPLLVITSLQVLRGERTVFAGVERGDWRRIVLLAIAALVCGFFWELWNYHSAARWVYAVPYVQGFKIFEMPLLGFAGYLPFGLECAVIADFLLGPRGDKRDAPAAAPLPPRITA